MAFKKGQPAHPKAGRPKGSLSKKRILKVEEVLTLNNFNPTEELLKMYQTMDDEQKIRVLCFLITYSQAKPAEEPQPNTSSAELSEKLKEVSDEQLIKAIEYKEKE